MPHRHIISPIAVNLTNWFDILGHLYRHLYTQIQHSELQRNTESHALPHYQRVLLGSLSRIIITPRHTQSNSPFLQPCFIRYFFNVLSQKAAKFESCGQKTTKLRKPLYPRCQIFLHVILMFATVVSRVLTRHCFFFSSLNF